jgi:hypothetical protein
MTSMLVTDISHSHLRSVKMKTKHTGDYNACMIVMPSQTKHLPQQKQKLKRLHPEKLKISFLTKQTTVQPRNLFKPKKTNKRKKNKEIASFAQNTYCKGLKILDHYMDYAWFWCRAVHRLVYICLLQWMWQWTKFLYVLETIQ